MCENKNGHLGGLFSLRGKTAFVTGGGGVLAGAIAPALGRAGANIALADLRGEAAIARAEELKKLGISAIGVGCDCLDGPSIAASLECVAKEFGDVSILVNTAGGNVKDATVAPGESIFGVPADALRKVIDLNLFAGVFLPAQVIGKHMAGHGKPSSIIHISSMAAMRPLSRVAGYGAAKAAVNNLTQWLAVHFAMELKAPIRVNAIAPGFFLTEQNRFLLTEHDGSLTPRGQTIMGHTPMGRFGEPDDLAGAVVWLASDASRFVTGTVIPVDGGFSAFSGV
ncbi:MAG: SDR family oxidoreductase [bacterium]